VTPLPFPPLNAIALSTPLCEGGDSPRFRPWNVFGASPVLILKALHVFFARFLSSSPTPPRCVDFKVRSAVVVMEASCQSTLPPFRAMTLSLRNYSFWVVMQTCARAARGYFFPPFFPSPLLWEIQPVPKFFLYPIATRPPCSASKVRGKTVFCTWFFWFATWISRDGISPFPLLLLV